MDKLIESLFKRGPLGQRARRLELVHPERRVRACLAAVERSDLGQPGLPEASFLHESELARAAAFRFGPARESFVLGRLAAKVALGAYLGEMDWTRIEVGRGVFGQPLVRAEGRSGVEVSLSHAGGEAVALAYPPEHPMAVDLETVDDRRAETVRKELRFRPEERSWIESGVMESRAAYVALWTMREALGKVLRCGLTCPLELLAVDRIEPQAEGLWESHYPNFGQYKCLTAVEPNRVFSMVLPKLTRPVQATA